MDRWIIRRYIHWLREGAVAVTVTDVNGCTIVGSTIITEPVADQSSFTSSDNLLEVTFTNTSSTGTYSWDFGDASSSIVTSPVHNYATSGTYTVCLTVNTDCDIVTNCEDLTVLMDNISVNEISKDFVLVYPNPTVDQITVKTLSEEARIFELIDALGKRVFEQKLLEEYTQIQLKELETGTYIYKIKDTKGNVLYLDKLIIKK